MILYDRQDDPLYVDEKELLRKRITYIEQLWREETDDNYTKITYNDGTIKSLNLSNESHDELVTLIDERQTDSE